MINNFIAIDTEYNNRREPLSIGISNFSKSIFEENYIKNRVDKRTYLVHGLPNSFIKDFGIDYKLIKPKIEAFINSNDLVGFDIEKDLLVLEINRFNKLYTNLKLIDIKSILNLLNLNYSLEYFAEILNLNETLSNFLPAHNSLTDAHISILILDKIIQLCINKGLSLESTVSQLKLITTLMFFKNNQWEIDQLEVEFNWLKEEFENIEKNKKREEKKIEILSYFIKEDIVFLLNHKNNVIYKIPNKYINKDRLENLMYNKEFIPIHLKIGLRFNNFFIKEQYKM